MDLRLGIEALAFVLSAAGESEAAHSLMLAQLGEMSSEEAHARLMAAGHSLVARELLSVAGDGEIHLGGALSEVASMLTQADFLVRCSRAYRDAEFVLSFYFKDGEILRHTLEDGVVHHLYTVDRLHSIIMAALEFFDLDDSMSFSASDVKLPYSVFRRIKDSDVPARITDELAEFDVPRQTRDLLIEDLLNTRFRGTVFRFVEFSDVGVQSNDGFLVLRGVHRGWVLPLYEEEGEVFVCLKPGSEQSLRREIRQLIGV